MQRRDIPAGGEKQYDVEHLASRQDVDSLIEALQSGDPTARRSAALGLGALGGEWRGGVDPSSGRSPIRCRTSGRERRTRSSWSEHRRSNR
ncbi:hypothetical protein [Methanoculleus chikugoensis]|uniref:hypothetical protein n=1 Tax=Methanoculleus chikugoensis TaxID=118126 RepID=UPI001FB40FD5|nr:hypothetical protein [Methanoculleus chikugoensis]